MFKNFKSITLYIFLSYFYLGSNDAYCQDTKYNRPSITRLYVGSTDRNELEVLNVIKSLPVEGQFNDHSINFNNIIIDLSKSSNDEYAAYKMNEINKFVINATNPIIAKWYGVDDNGDFHTEYIRNRAMYSATDDEAIADKASKSSHIDVNGISLINKTYIMVYSLDGVQTMEEYYNDIDNNNRKYKNYVPTSRTDEGYLLKYTIHLYKLDFNEDVEAKLNENYWVDNNNHDESKVEAFKSATFPVNYISRISSTIFSKQPKDPNASIYRIQSKQSMQQLLDALGIKLEQDAVVRLTEKVGDLQVKSSIFQERPLTSKIGTKEGLSLDQRFYVYEFRVNTKTSVKSKVRVGIVRATANISENRENATGNMKPSVFVQQGGKRLYQGMLLELKDDKGIGISAGYSDNAKDPSVGGVYLGLELNISKILYKIFSGKKTPGGIYLGAHLMFNSFNKIDPGIVSNSLGNWLMYGNNSGSTFSYYFNLSKEYYFFRRGNIYLIPSLGVGLSTISVNEAGGVKIDTSMSKYYNWSALCSHVGVGIGLNLGPKFTIILNPELVSKAKYTDQYGNAIECLYKEDISNDWQNTFANVGLRYRSTLITLKLKFRI